MSEYTSNLQLFKYDTATDGKEVFSINASMNDNWDKIDAFAAGIKSLSNLDAQGEKRFTDINTELNKKLEAEVLLAENGYIKFNNNVLIQWGACRPTANTTSWTLPTSYTNTLYKVCAGQVRGGGSSQNLGITLRNVTYFNLYAESGERSQGCFWVSVGY